MNFMSSISVGDAVFVPFWVLLEYYDATPPYPFIRCIVLNAYSRTMTGSDGNATVDYVDLSLGKPGLTANAVPAEVLISEGELPEWRQKISDWFLTYKPECS
jgi:hypothetical protein